jgi:hypothetical protein
MDLSEKIKIKNNYKKCLVYFEKSTTLTIFLTSITYITLNSLEIIDNKLLNIFGAVSSILVLINDYTKYNISNINEKIQELEKTNLIQENNCRILFSSNQVEKQKLNYWIPFCNF